MSAISHVEKDTLCSPKFLFGPMDWCMRQWSWIRHIEEGSSLYKIMQIVPRIILSIPLLPLTFVSGVFVLIGRVVEIYSVPLITFFPPCFSLFLLNKEGKPIMGEKEKQLAKSLGMQDVKISDLSIARNLVKDWPENGYTGIHLSVYVDRVIWDFDDLLPKPIEMWRISLDFGFSLIKNQAGLRFFYSILANRKTPVRGVTIGKNVVKIDEMAPQEIKDLEAAYREGDRVQLYIAKDLEHIHLKIFKSEKIIYSSIK